MQRIKKHGHAHPKTAAFLLGGSTALGFAPLYWWPVSLVSLAAFFGLVFGKEAQQTRAFKSTLMLGWVFGTGFSLASLWWIGASFRYTPLGWWAVAAAPFTLTGLAALMGLWYMAVIGGARKLQPILPFWAFPVIIALLWTLMEGVRSLSVYGLPWHLFGYTFAGNLYLIQPAAYGTVLLLSFLGVLFSAALATQERKITLVYAVVVCAVFGLGALRVVGAPPLEVIAKASLYQTSLRQDVKWQHPAYARARENFNILQNAPQSSDIILLPETAFTFVMQSHPNLTKLIDDMTPPHQSVIFGIPSTQNGRYYNSAFSTSGYGETLGTFHKKNLVPFGEFIPLKHLIPDFLKHFAPANTYSAGTTSRNLKTSAGNALPIICYEVIFPYHILRATHEFSPDFIINLTNDGWFWGTTGAHQHFAIARIRSVETGLTQIRVANSGISAFIDGYGRVKKRLNSEQSGYLTGSIFEQVRAR